MSKKDLSALLGLTPAIEQVSRIASASADAALTEGAVSPDQKLLELCASALDHVVAFKRTWDRMHTEAGQLPHKYYKDYAEDLSAELHAAKPMLREAAKIKATTAAGIYAKAMLIRGSKTGAAVLAMSLAEDLLACEPLRRMLWESWLPRQRMGSPTPIRSPPATRSWGGYHHDPHRR